MNSSCSTWQVPTLTGNILRSESPSFWSCHHYVFTSFHTWIQHWSVGRTVRVVQSGKKEKNCLVYFVFFRYDSGYLVQTMCSLSFVSTYWLIPLSYTSLRLRIDLCLIVTDMTLDLCRILWWRGTGTAFGLEAIALLMFFTGLIFVVLALIPGGQM